MADLSPQIAVAQRLISAYGRSVTFEKLGTPMGIPPLPSVAKSLTVDAVFVSPSGLGFAAQSSDLLRRALQIAIVAPGPDVDLLDFSQIQDSGVTWRIEGIEILRPGTQTVLGYVSVQQ